MSEESTKKRRLASGQACISCKRRKGRCDGEKPTCGPCRSRLVTCQYSETTSNTQGLEPPSKRIATSSTPSATGSHVHPSGPSFTPSNGASATDGMGLLWSAASDVFRSSNQNTLPPIIQHSVSRAAAEDVLRHSVHSSRAASAEPDGYFGDSSTFAFVSKAQPRSIQSERSGVAEGHQRHASTLQSIMATSVESDPQRFELPGRRFADDLVDAYFERVHPFYPFIHEGSFRVQYERIWARSSSSLSSSSLSWQAVLNLVFARGCEFCTTIPREDSVNTLSSFIDRARSIIFSQVFKRGNLELVQALLLMCQYLQGTLEFNECWNLVGLMIRTAVSIGLHLNPEGTSLTPIEKEVRKRVWWGCFILDRTSSMKFGRPPSIQAIDDIEVPYPLTVDDQYIVNDSLVPRQPSGRPSITDLFIHTLKLVQIVDSILRDLYTTKNMPVKDTKDTRSTKISGSQSQIIGHAVLLDGDLRTWWDEVPAHLRPDSSTADGPAFQRQKIVMQIRYFQMRLLLQRQLHAIFSQQDVDDDFLRAVTIAGSRTCIELACESIKLICNYHRHGLLNSLWYNLHYVFTSVGVLITLQSMDKSKLDLLGYDQEPEALGLGMGFLQETSKTSPLAAKYVSVLMRARSRSKKGARLENMPSGNASTVGSSDIVSLEHARDPINSASQSPWQTSGVEKIHAAIDLDGMNFEDFLLGPGFGQGGPSFEYPGGGFVL